MKRSSWIFSILFVLVLAIVAPALASDGELEAAKLEKPFSFSGSLKFDLYAPKGQPAFTEYGVSLYAHRKLNKDWGLGIGADQWGGTDKQQSNHWTARPFATVNWKQFYGIAGYSVDTRKTGDNHMFFGMWYIDKIGRFDILLDSRYYASQNKRLSDFVDIFGEVKFALNDTYKIGVVGEYIGWFGKDRGHNWSFAAIEGERKFQGFSLGLRPGIAWDMTPKGTVPTFWLRTYCTF